MDFNTLHETIPYAKGGKEKILSMHPFPGIKLMLPGRHALDTKPIGGDFVVCVTDVTWNWNEHQFTHGDLFKRIDSMADQTPGDAQMFMQRYYDVVVEGAEVSPEDSVLTYAVLCLAVAEHRRYSQYERKGGGRYLPLRFSAGVAEGLWSAEDGAMLQKTGRPAVEMLERKNGMPALTQRLLDRIKNG